MATGKHGIPALISFFIPGLGQLIKGQIMKALLIWIIGGLISFFLFWTIIVPFLIWAWNVYDAYNSNEA
jgi:TM2 domain-containing membrane protein YozV